jgi:hypothetical protein
LSINASNKWASARGIAASVEIGSKAINTSDNDKWLCSIGQIKKDYPRSCSGNLVVSDWWRYNYNTSCNLWEKAKNMGNVGPNDYGNKLPYKQIWSTNTKDFYTTCRLKFSIP